MSYTDFTAEVREIAQEAMLNDTQILHEALSFIVDTENVEAFRAFLRQAALEHSHSDEVAYDDRKLYCLPNGDGSISPAYMVCEKCGPEHKFEIERAAKNKVASGDWQDCTDRVHELSCAVCRYPEKEYEVEVVRIGYGHRAVRLWARHDKGAADKALDEAGNHLYSEVDADYEVNSVEVVE